MEDKFKAILEDRQVPDRPKEACAWGSLALGMRFACRQSQLHGHRVQWLHDLAGLHKSAAHALASDLKLYMAQHMSWNARKQPSAAANAGQPGEDGKKGIS